MSEDTPGEDIYKRFAREPDTLAIAVVDGEGRPVGLVERHAFLAQMASQYGRALWARRPISFLMNASPLIAEGDVAAADFCRTTLQDRPSELLHGFIVTRGGRYAGVGTMMALLQVASAQAQAASREARAALESKSRFLAVMSHEIRTPLNGVLAVAEILRRQSVDEDQRRLVDTILDSGGVLLRLLNDILDLSRAEAAGLQLNTRRFRVCDLVDEARRLWTPPADVKGVVLDARYEGEADAWALGDDVRLAQILNNLISNALKFTPQGAVAATLLARPDGGDLRLSLRVADCGPGVPQEMRQAIFAPFQQTDEGVRRGGAGLGLAVCRQLVERMGGTIEALDNPGGGALFAVDLVLPRAEPAAAAAPAAEAVAPGDDGAAAPVRAHVLIADDNPVNRLVAERLCAIFGCTSESVEDGLQAVAAAAQGRFDLILMDIRMPHLDGVEATRRIRASTGAPSRIPIIALTANADPADAAFYRQAGMNGVASKPINPEQLLAAMNAVLHAPQDAPPAVLVA